MHVRRVIPLASAALLLAAGAAGTWHAPAAAGDSSRSPKVHVLGNVATDGVVHYREAGLDSAPAPAGAAATIGAVAAVAGFLDEGWNNLSGNVPDARLQLVSDGNFSIEPVPGGRIVQHYKDRLAWVLTFHHITPHFFGKPGGAQPDPSDFTCDIVGFVDARTGQTMEALQLCHY